MKRPTGTRRRPRWEIILGLGLLRIMFLEPARSAEPVDADVLLRAGTLYDGSGSPAPFAVQVEVDEIVCSLAPYQETNNGSGMFWGSGSSQIARIGDRLFVSAFEPVPGCAPLNNARWALYERTDQGWKLRQRDEKDRTREPCPLCVSHSGRLLLSANPTLVAPIPVPAAGSGGDVAVKPVGGPARPEFLEFDPAHPEREPRRFVPPWNGEPKFTEHSYRTFAADGASGDFILFQNVGSTHSQWALLDHAGSWKTGELVWPMGEDPRYAPYHDERARVNYPNAVLHRRAVHFIGTSPYNIWNRIDPLKTETWGREKWGWRMRRLHYAWTPDITREPFRPWTVVAETMDDGGTLHLGDTWLAPAGRVHLVWQQDPIHPRLRDLHFPDIKRDWRLCHAVLDQGRVSAKRVLFAGGETTGPLQPAGRPRFHISPDQTCYLLFSLSGTTPATQSQTGSYAVRIEADGAVSSPVRLPLQTALASTFFTATPRSGNRLSDCADLLISSTVEGKPVARYIRLRFGENGGASGS